MKNLFLMLSLMISSVLLSQEYVEWKPNYKLTFSDFKGQVPTKNAGNVNLATTISFQTTQVNGKVKDFVIYNRFDKSKSWIKSKKQSILDLQQVHFDLSELYARKIRKEVEGLKAKKVGEKEKYVEIVNKYTQKLHQYRQSKNILLEDQPHLIQVLQKEIKDSLEIYKAYQK